MADQARDGTERLTPTEARIVRLVCRGLTNPQIARELYVEHSTVRWHLRNVFRKLAVRTRTELAAMQLKNGRDPEALGPTLTPSPTSVRQALDEGERTEGNTT